MARANPEVSRFDRPSQGTGAGQAEPHKSCAARARAYLSERVWQGAPRNRPAALRRPARDQHSPAASGSTRSRRCGWRVASAVPAPPPRPRGSVSAAHGTVVRGARDAPPAPQSAGPAAPRARAVGVDAAAPGPEPQRVGKGRPRAGPTQPHGRPVPGARLVRRLPRQRHRPGTRRGPAPPQRNRASVDVLRPRRAGDQTYLSVTSGAGTTPHPDRARMPPLHLPSPARQVRAHL